MSNESDRNRVTELLQKAYRDIVPTPTERQRHLTNIARTSPGMATVPWRRRQGILEAVVILSVVVLVVGGISLWGALGRGERNTTQPTAVVAASVPDATPSPTASSCPETVVETELPNRMIANPYYKDWYGNGGLWFSPISVTSVNSTVAETGARWFAGGMMATAEWPFQADDTFVLTGQRLDGAATTYEETIPHDDIANGFEITIPEPGCWEITATVRDLSLTIVANVLPQTDRPDLRQALDRQAAMMPYPAPSDCGPGWDGPIDRYGNYSPAFWIDLEDFSIRSSDGVLWANEPYPLEWFPAEWGDITIDGHLVDGSMRLGFAADNVHRVGVGVNSWYSTLLFGAPGCWELSVTSGDITNTVNVWVYPETCRREPGAALPDECRPPR